jgi:hypothetical protein
MADRCSRSHGIAEEERSKSILIIAEDATLGAEAVEELFKLVSYHNGCVEVVVERAVIGDGTAGTCRARPRRYVRAGAASSFVRCVG